jgi:hypothetical protein
MRHVAAGRFTIEIMDELIISALPRKGWVTDEVWKQYVDFCVGLVKKHGPFHAWLVMVFEHGPTAPQRKYLVETSRDALKLTQIYRSIMVTDSTFLRGILTAAQWMSRTDMQTMGVSPKNVRGGIEWMNERAKFDPAAAMGAYEALLREGKD